MSSKVFCKDCKFIYPPDMLDKYQCYCLSEEFDQLDYVTGAKDPPLCMHINTRGECKYYKEKESK